MGRVATGLIAVALIGFGIGCGAVLFPGRPTMGVDEYAAAQVRVYRIGPRVCRVEVTTATDTIQTTAARCVVVPRRQVSGGP